jgi:hypothetical protein
VIRDEDRPTVRAISLQRWAGQFWSGQWEHQQYLAVPTARGGKGTTGEADAELEADADAEAEAEPEVDADEDADLDDDEADDSETPGRAKKK